MGKVTTKFAFLVTLNNAQLRTLQRFVRGKWLDLEANPQLSSAVLVANSFITNNIDQDETQSYWCGLWRWFDTPSKHPLINFTLGGTYEVNWLVGVVVILVVLGLLGCIIVLAVNGKQILRP